MGAIIIGGLASSTLLTLLVVPAAYSILASILRLFAKPPAEPGHPDPHTRREELAK